MTAKRKRPAGKKLTVAQRMELIVGRDPAAPAFASEAQARAAWVENRAILLRQVNPGSRPSAFWKYESDGVDRDYRSGLAWLVERDLLRPDEVRKLREWEADCLYVETNGGESG